MADREFTEWELIYTSWDPEQQPLREALCALGNGRIVTRSAFEEARGGRRSLSRNVSRGRLQPSGDDHRRARAGERGSGKLPQLAAADVSHRRRTVVRSRRGRNPRHGFKPIGKFTTWLHTIAGNLARSEYRKKKRIAARPLYTVGPQEEEYQIPLLNEAHPPNRLAESRLHAEEIQRALAKIPDPYREVVTLRDVQQLTYEEIAEITGLPLGTVKSRIHRGRTVLQELLRHVRESD